MANTLQRLLGSNDTWAPLVMRLALGVVIFPHGAQKLLGAFGGHGFAGTMGYLTGSIGLPSPLAFLVIFAEFFGSLALILGALTRLAALGIGAVMIGAIATVHMKVGFFMNWAGQAKGEGFEYHLLALGLVVALMIVGGGRFSLDRILARVAGARVERRVA